MNEIIGNYNGTGIHFLKNTPHQMFYIKGELSLSKCNYRLQKTCLQHAKSVGQWSRYIFSFYIHCFATPMSNIQLWLLWLLPTKWRPVL